MKPKLVQSLLFDLEQFQHLKSSRWEQVEASIQMTNRLGSPTEDWIIPPDEEEVRKVLEQDPDYVKLRKSIQEKTPLIIEEAKTEGFDTHHELDWLKFTDPLIGTSAVQDAISCLRRMSKVSE
jgi:hypothetical protein